MQSLAVSATVPSDAARPSPSPDVAFVSALPRDAVAVRLIEALLERGVSTFFGIPGGPIAPLFEALRLNPAAKLICVRHETHAAFAAASYYRLTGQVSAVVVTAGPGITNALTGVASAHTERVPMLVISGDVAANRYGGRLLQDCGREGLDIEQVFASVTRTQVRVNSPRNALSQAIHALDSATDPKRPGPALLVLPMDHATQSIARVALPAPTRDHAVRPASGTVRQAAHALATARRPLLVLGGACLGFSESVRTLVDALGVPFITTPRAKGVVSEEHPFSLRNGGMAASGWARRYTAGGVDVALVLGTDLDDVSIGATPYVADGGRLVHVDTDPSVFNRNLPVALGVTADLGIFATELRDLVTRLSLHNERGEGLCRKVKTSSPYDAPDFASDASIPIRPDRALHDLQSALPDARFIADIGEHMLFCLHYLLARRPDDFHIQLGLGSMASGIAGATGLALADSTRPVVCVCGDGGMHMAGMELLTSKQLDLPIVYAVFNDSRYNMVHHGMKQTFGAAAPHSTPDVDFALWARSMGVPAAVITRAGAIDEALLRALRRAGGPVLLDIRIDPEVRIRGAGRVEALQRMSMHELGGVK